MNTVMLADSDMEYVMMVMTLLLVMRMTNPIPTAEEVRVFRCARVGAWNGKPDPKP